MQILSTGKQRAGRVSRISVGGTSLCFASWENVMSAEDYPTVNFESYNSGDAETYDEGLHGPIVCNSRFGGDWDAGTVPLGPTGFPSTSATPPSLYPRDDLANLIMIPNRVDGTTTPFVWTFPYFRVRSATNSTDVRGKVLFNAAGMNQGRFTFPITNS